MKRGARRGHAEKLEQRRWKRILGVRKRRREGESDEEKGRERKERERERESSWV